MDAAAAAATVGDHLDELNRIPQISFKHLAAEIVNTSQKHLKSICWSQLFFELLQQVELLYSKNPGFSTTYVWLRYALLQGDLMKKLSNLPSSIAAAACMELLQLNFEQ
jgi:methionyl-tRNA formyltransferase